MDLRDVTEFLRDTIWYIVAFLIILFIFTFIIAFQIVAGNSMSPTIEDGSVACVSRFAYIIGKPQRNEIVIIKKDKKSYVKRVIGLPGEKIEYLNGILYVNDEPFKETFLKDGVVTTNFLFNDICNKKDCPDKVIPEDKYLVLGDNRPESEDSRSKTFGLVDKSEIKGKVLLIVYPFTSFGGVN